MDGGSGGAGVGWPTLGRFFNAVPVACCCIATARSCCMLLHCHRLADVVLALFPLAALSTDSYFIDSGLSKLLLVERGVV